ncbi:MAG: hypothetical protein JEZ00_09095 [Anaerolineaceae bacterium]|nr:hypothetical protein [Anaerolineaceae bacterium]
MDSINIPITYPGLGKCIYCGKSNTKLSKEHIIPFGLGGNLILSHSSCKGCAKITSQFERFIQHEMLGPARIKLNLPTRRPQKRPKQLTLVYHSGDMQKKFESLSIEEFPSVIAGFDFPEPALLRNIPYNDHKISEGRLIIKPIVDITKNEKYKAGKKIKIGSFSVLEYKRFLAKIAHSYYIAQFNNMNFTPFLPDFILGKNNQLSYYVGGGNHLPNNNSESNILHHLYRQDCIHNGIKYIGIVIHLFAFANMPKYYVIVGR